MADSDRPQKSSSTSSLRSSGSFSNGFIAPSKAESSAHLPIATDLIPAAERFIPEQWKGDANEIRKGDHRIDYRGAYYLGEPLPVRWPVSDSLLARIKTPITIKNIEVGKIIGNTRTRKEEQKGVEVRKARVKLNEAGEILLGIAAYKIYAPDALKVASYELDALQALHHTHQNVVQSYNVFYANSQITVLMEYMDRGSVEHLIRIIGPLPSDVVAVIIRQVVQGLQFLHKNGLLHRNLKPSNVFLNKHGQVKIGDFCVAKKIRGVDQLGAHTVDIGSSEYRPPETLANDISRTEACDSWQVGVLTAHGLYGTYPLLCEADLANIAQANQVARTLEQLNYCLNRFNLATRLKDKTIFLDYALMDREVTARCGGTHPQMPPGARALIDSCLKIDPTLRPTCAKLLKMAFVDLISARMDENSLSSWLLEKQIKEKLKGVTDGQNAAAIRSSATNANDRSPNSSSSSPSDNFRGK